MSDREDKERGRDFLVPLAPDGDGGDICVRHDADHNVQLCRIVPLKHGVPMDPDGQVVRLTPGEGPGVDVEVLYDRREPGGKGPARVTSPEYRANFDRIFGTRPEIGSA